SRERVAVLGRAVSDLLFGDGDNPVGRTIAVRDRPFTIVGVARTPEPTEPSDNDQSEMVFVPYTALQDLLGIGYLHAIAVETAQAGDASRVAADITSSLRRRHAAHIEAANAAVARLRQGGVLGNQMPQAGAGVGAADDFTVKTQAAEA